MGVSTHNYIFPISLAFSKTNNLMFKAKRHSASREDHICGWEFRHCGISMVWLMKLLFFLISPYVGNVQLNGFEINFVFSIKLTFAWGQWTLNSLGSSQHYSFPSESMWHLSNKVHLTSWFMKEKSVYWYFVLFLSTRKPPHLDKEPQAINDYRKRKISFPELSSLLCYPILRTSRLVLGQRYSLATS